MPAESVLVNFVYCHPVADVLSHVPRDWDWIVDDPRGHQSWQRELFPGLAAYHDIAAEHFRGWHSQVGRPESVYRPGNRLDLALPAEARDWAENLLPRNGSTIAVLPGWQRPAVAVPVAGLVAAHPACPRGPLSGRAVLPGRQAGRRRTHQYHPDPRGVRRDGRGGTRRAWAVDVPLAHQLAAVRRCDLFVSPHSGFAFTAAAVGTPWLALAGNDWAEYYFNPGVPFYSVLPYLDRFPCYVMLGNNPDPVEDDGPRSPSMSAARIDADLDELLDGAAWLLGEDADFDTAMDPCPRAERTGMVAGGQPPTAPPHES